jgi:hypothetical protein
MNANPRIEAPRHSLEPLDWLMYCDLLLDSGGSPRRAGAARRIGASLEKSKALVLVLHCPQQQLRGHWLQVGRMWFIPVNGTQVSYCNDFQWWRPEWIRSGFARYPHEDRIDPEGMLLYASGTPFEHGYADFPAAVAKFGQKVALRFFETHGRVRVPRAWV